MNVQRTNGKLPAKKRLLTGLLPTGKFHLGNYVGTFEKDVELRLHKEREDIGIQLYDIFNGSSRRISTSIMVSHALNALNFHSHRMTEDIISWLSNDNEI